MGLVDTTGYFDEKEGKRTFIKGRTTLIVSPHAEDQSKDRNGKNSTIFEAAKLLDESEYSNFKKQDVVIRDCNSQTILIFNVNKLTTGDKQLAVKTVYPAISKEEFESFRVSLDDVILDIEEGKETLEFSKKDDFNYKEDELVEEDEFSF